ncbi:MAG: metal-dependent hydrolase [Candidatus Altiarchaeota archaeon]
MEVRWHGHAAFEIETLGKRIFLDPYELPLDFKTADIILVTHEHYDHCDNEAIKKIKTKETVIIANEITSKKLSGNLKSIKEGETLSLGDIKISAVPAYNMRKPFHKKNFGVGFIVEAENKKVYHAGDTDLIPEMNELAEKKINLALLPIGGTYTMNFSEAAEAVKIIKPEIVVPMHYAKIVGSLEDAENFKKKVEMLNLETKVKIMNVSETIKI